MISIGTDSIRVNPAHINLAWDARAGLNLALYRYCKPYSDFDTFMISVFGVTLQTDAGCGTLLMSW